MSKILVFGAAGQLGTCIRVCAEHRSGLDLIMPEESKANILDVDALHLLFEETQPDYVINCAAYTAVDKAESDIENARLINKVGAGNLAALCHAHEASLIHISTDFVFEGTEVKLLKETDVASPISVYGLTKLEGEQAIIDKMSSYFILRTSWLYSEYGNNFVKTMQRLGSERDSLSIIADQIGSPTYAVDLANAVLSIIEKKSDEFGVYHYSNEGAVSWFDFAKSIFELSDISVNVTPIPTEQYPTPAKRPAFSVMDKSLIKNTFGLTIPYWRESLSLCINNLKNQIN